MSDQEAVADFADLLSLIGELEQQSDEWPPMRPATAHVAAEKVLASNWLAERDRRMKAEGVREAAEAWPTLTRDMVSRGQVREWLTTRADRVEAEE